MYKIINEKSGESAELVLNGPLTIQTCAEIKQALTGLYNNVNTIIIDYRAAESLDISYFQILLSLKTTMNKDGKILKLKGTNNTPFISLINDLGCPSFDWLTEEFEQNSGDTKND